MFKQGLKHGAYVIVLTLLAFAISIPFKNKEVLEWLVGSTVILSWLGIGYHYKKHYGSLFLNFMDAEKQKGILYYLLGIGLIWGPAKLFSSEFPITDINPIINLILLVISVPLSALSIVGALFMGGFFYRAKD